MTVTSLPQNPLDTEISMDEIDAILDKTKGAITDEERELLRRLVTSYGTVLDELGNRRATIKRLRQLIFGTKTESKKKLLGKKDEAAAKDETTPKKKRKGHGRIPAADYTGARRVKVPHESLSTGEPCPHCEGKVYEKDPRFIVRVRGCAPLAATVYEQERLRCNLCGEVFNAKPLPEVGEKKFDETVASMVGMLRYGNGFPMNRIAVLQEAVGVPLPVSTQWELAQEAADKLEPALNELLRQAAQGRLLYNDDTTMRLLDFMEEKKKREERGEKPLKRTGTFTSGIVSELPGGERVVLYFTGQQHAGENLAKVLAKRASGLAPPIQMCDGLERNLPANMKTILANCLAHARRKYVDVMDSFPEQVEYVIEEFALVYENDACAKSEELSAEERLRLHQQKSAPVMERLKQWMDDLFEEEKVEPNSGLGKAMAYAIKHWDTLTLFLRVPGAPIDNNLTERMLKRAILHRKGSLFYKTKNGARVGDLYMSLIETAKLAKANPFDYLNVLQRRADEVAANPSEWMPWNYRETLERADPTS